MAHFVHPVGCDAVLQGDVLSKSFALRIMKYHTDSGAGTFSKLESVEAYVTLNSAGSNLAPRKLPETSPTSIH